jgi:small subunit ribosomal protein S12
MRHTLLKHNHVLIRGGRVKDMPGCKFKGMRGLLDFRGVVDRKTAKTKYGVKQTIEMRRELRKPFMRKLL